MLKELLEGNNVRETLTKKIKKFDLRDLSDKVEQTLVDIGIREEYNTTRKNF